LAAAGASLEDTVRVRYILPNAADFAEAAPVCAEHFARARPAATMMVAGLIDPRIKIEIEVTARRVRAETAPPRP
jgi:enamine deaminase RidA (YjgF/YER057c/UK114 family)